MTEDCQCGSIPRAQSKQQALTEIDWYKAVQEYSLREMTFESDKFPALSGIAKATVQ